MLCSPLRPLKVLEGPALNKMKENSHYRDIFCRQMNFLLQLHLRCKGTALFLALLALGIRATAVKRCSYALEAKIL